MFAIGSSAGSASSGQVQTWPDLIDVSTEAVGFQSIAGQTRLRILPTPWPINSLPKPTSSLLSIASHQELLAAAGPDVLVIGSTSAIRESFVKEGPSENNVKQFQPQLTLQVPRLSQVAFSSDESTLIISAAEGGGLQIYDVSALKRGSSEPAFQLPTNGVAVRALIPNPAQESGHLIALVLEQGDLMLANLRDRKFENGQNSMVLKGGVSCVSWSNKGKQLTAGLGNGTAIQLTPSGEVKAELPRYPQLDGDQHVSGISWLDNEHWLVIYTPSQFHPELAKDSTYCYLTREKGTKNFAFQRFTDDPCAPFGMNRSPAFHFINRLREYPPSLVDVILLASTAAGDIGMIACSRTPLSTDGAAANTANQYSTVSIANDSRKAQLPVDESMADTSPIGAAIDLSSKDIVSRPIPAEEIDASPNPLPGLAVLNNEGVLSYWWFVYSDSVRQGKAYPGLMASSAGQQINKMQEQLPAPQVSTGPGAFGRPQAAFGSTSTPSSSPFGKSVAAAFGTPSTPSSNAFGGSSALGQSKSPWVSASATTPQSGGTAFGRPAFGSSTPMKSDSGFGPSNPASGPVGGFGAVGGLGQSKSPWASAITPSQTEQKPNPFSSANTSSPFAAFGQKSDPSSQSPFSGLSGTTSGFASLGQTSKTLFENPSTTTPSSLTNQPSFGSTVTIGSNLTNGSSGGISSFGEPKSAWGTPSLSQRPSGMNEIKEADMADTMEDADSKTETAPPMLSPDHGFGLFNKPNTSPTGFQMPASIKPGKETKEKTDSQVPGQSMFGKDFTKTLTDTQETSATEPAAAAKGAPRPLFGEITSPERASSFETRINAAEERTSTKEAPAKAFDSKVIKNEPRDDVDDAPLPPDPSTYKARAEKQSVSLPPDSSSDEAQAIPEPAPLPPDPSTYKGRAEPEPAPLPPSPKPQKAEVDANEPALPPSPRRDEVPPSTDDLPPSPAGSSPVDLGAKSPEEASPPQPETPASIAKNVAKPNASWAFPSDTPQSSGVKDLGQSMSPLPPSFAPTPTTIGKTEPATTPFGAGKPIFPPPSSSKQTPRSPSPTQRGRLFAAQRSVTSPSPSRRNFSTTPSVPPPTRSMLPPPTPDGSRQVSRQSLFSDSARQQPMNEGARLLRGPTSRDQSPITQKRGSQTGAVETDLGPPDDYDTQDAQIVAELSAPIQSTKTLASFLAHQDYVGRVGGSGVPAEIEKVYRDINSMIDTLGLNARSLRAWTAGNEQFRDGGRTREDLDIDEPGAEEWSLIEIADLNVVQKELSETLDSERIDSVRSKVAELVDIRREIAKLRQRNATLQQIVYKHQYPDDEDGSESTPQAKRTNRSSTASPSPRRIRNGLAPEQSALLLSLRKSFTSLSGQLSTAEDALTLLRAKLASSTASAGTGSTSFSSSTSSFRASTTSPPTRLSTTTERIPTVEAVISTVAKMTRMVEQRSGDLDVLEARMKRLRFNARTDAQGLDEVMGAMSLSREGTPLTSKTLPLSSRRSRMMAKRTAARGAADGKFELTYSEDEDEGAVEGWLEGELEAAQAAKYVLRVKRRERIAALLKKSVTERGTRISGPT